MYENRTQASTPRMTRARRSQHLIIHRHRRRHELAPTFSIIVTRQEAQQLGGGEQEDQDMRMRDGHRLVGDEWRAVTGKATETISSAEWLALVFVIIGMLLGLIQIMYQSRKDSPFETNPATMAITVAALCICGFAAAALINSRAVKVEEEEQQTTGHLPYCHRALIMLVLISGVVTLSCLVFLFVPKGFGRTLFVSCASIISAVVVGWHFMSLIIFGRTKFSCGEPGPNMV